MKRWYVTSKYLKIGGIIGVLVIAGILCMIFVPKENDDSEFNTITQESVLMLGIHVSGCVVNPDALYYLPEGSRVQDAIEAAGGATAEADLSKLNLAALLKDGQKITVYSVQEESETDGLININEADATELQTLSGIGPSLAGKIIAYREENGPFSDIEELKLVSGIGEKLYASLEDKIRV